MYRSNRAEFLARLLAAQLRLAPPPPLETAVVVVNTWPTSRWLGERLAEALGGVAANLRFPFPAARLRQLVDEVLAEEEEPAGAALPGAAAEPSPDPWRASRLVWPLLELLPELAACEVGAPLRQWLARRSDGRRLDLATWQLGRAIADAFDDYALYRPELLRAWGEGQEAADPLPETLRWQPPLYAALRARLGVDPAGLRMERAIERLRCRPAPSPTAAPVQPLRLFGLSSLAPVQVRLLQALSGQRCVELYLLTPCADLWQRCQNRRRQLHEALQQPLDLDWLLEAPPLEARFGRLGAEFQQLLEGTGEAQLGEERVEELFFAPASRHPEGPGAAPLLAQLQEQLARGDGEPLQLPPGDSSLEFHPCPGPLRQVEIVRDRLLQLMAQDPSLQPRDILVMTPQVDRFAPLVASVFGDREAVGIAIPWRLTDRSQQSQAGIGRTLLALLRLGGERLTASALEGLLECRPLQQRFGLSPGEAARLNGVLQRCGFRWGLDAVARGGDPVHSLAWAIDRLLLGLVLPERPGLALGSPAALEDTWAEGETGADEGENEEIAAEIGAAPDTAVAPAVGASDLALTGRWLHLLTRLRHWLALVGRAADGPAWAGRLRELLADLFGDGGEAAWELPALLAAIDDWQQAAAGTALLLEAPVVAAVLDEALAVDSGRFGHRSGSLTISALEPMRAIPHRVIVLLGLDADVFPRQRDRPGFHLMERQRRLGDPQSADQDRYVLLEALLSARSHLLISWSCRDDRSGEALPPAGPVRQWLQWLEGQLGRDALAALVAEHPAGPLERANFQPRSGRPPASCDRRRLAALRLLEQATPAPPRGLARTAPPAGEPPSPADPATRFDDLAAWLREPQRQWLRQLGMKPGEWLEPLEDLEALELNEPQRSRLLRPLLQDGVEDPEAGRAQTWRARSRGQGSLPAGAAGALEARALAERWGSLQDTLAQLGAPWQQPLAWGPWQAAPRWRGESVVLTHTGRAGPGHRVDLWLQLLLAAAAAPDTGRTPLQGALIARDGNRLAVALRLQAPEPAAARGELERLAALREAWRQACWPVPPRTGWAWRAREEERPGEGFEAARKAWEGDGVGRPEREEEVMVVCFGAERSASALIDASFGERADALYGPLLAAEIRPARGRSGR
ncbi:MAG: exodeoxyribonuclease V subunit gamma [Synechococcaceae cyanobacterium]|nr:exodeoxyribonuclease V subunit gamma [Synechococcaceae cyanobacterium]